MTVTDIVGDVIVKRRWATLVSGVPGLAEEVARVPAVAAATAEFVPVAADGHLYRPEGRFYFGERYAERGVGRWDDGAGLVYFDWVSRVVLARETHDRPLYAPAGDLGAPERPANPDFRPPLSSPGAGPTRIDRESPH